MSDGPRAIVIEGVPSPSAGPTEPYVLASEHQVLLPYRVAESEGGGVAVLRFSSPVAVFQGAPNDEALDQHPLWNRGLGFYGVYRVEHSTWREQMQDRGVRRNTSPPPVWSTPTHYIVTMHDSTFECLATNLAHEVRSETVAHVVARLAGAPAP
ncbi:MAG: hypothetical protein ACRDLP_12820 [Solirubrobacteraceae bacterium]